ncbi:MAG TPA: TetR/AcrR family transcriptional regulator [Tenuifilaceae bacterium]|nr:TetR/AcrR family transcriptional regulator [Tenuifilaceae bacterium]
MKKEKGKEQNAHSNMRNDIVSIAAGVFAKFGFKKTTVDDIAHALRKGKSSIYYYFSSKEDIFKAVVDREAEALREKIEVILSSSQSTVDKIRAYVKTRMLAVRVMANYYTLIKNNDISNLDLVEKLRSKYDTEEHGIIKKLLADGVASGEFKEMDIELSSVALLTAMKGLEIPLFITSSKAENLETVLDDMLNILFYGIVIRNE